MILESIVTTVDDSGRVNIAPMGPHVDGPDFNSFTLVPFRGSTTCKNLLSTGQATIHVTDDVDLFARSAIGRVDAGGLVTTIDDLPGTGYWRLIDCHRWFALSAQAPQRDGPRYQIRCDVIASGVERPFFGFNRAKHAVIEASILATRLNLIDHAQIAAELEKLAVLVDKTAGDQERIAFDWLVGKVRAKMSP